MAKTLYILAPYPLGQAPSQRFRFEQYLEDFEKNGYEVKFHSFLSDKTWDALYRNGTFFKKAFGIIGSFFRRTGLLFKLRKADIIFIHREASMIGPPIFEWWIAKILRKPFIYDFDDAIWLPNYSDSNARFHRLKAYGKVRKIMKWAKEISAGNDYLVDFAKQYNESVRKIPTTIDTINVHNIPVDHSNSKLIIGWTGSHTTMNYLQKIGPVIRRLEEKYDFEYRVISNHKPELDLKSFVYVPWSKEDEIEQLSKIQIGVMPLVDNVWIQGKCGFKALQYMSLGAAAVVENIGANPDIFTYGTNGMLCSTEQEWYEKLETLLTNSQLREQLGKAGMKTVENSYSANAQLSNYLDLLSS